MKKVIHKADTRGHSKYEWLDSYHTFSFDEYFDSNRINFGALRVLNDDKVAPGEGFQTHPHKNMEIVSFQWNGDNFHILVRIPDASAQEYGNCLHSTERTSATW